MMDAHILHEFLVLAEIKNYQEAAEILFVSQPTLTRHIKMLEDEINKPLFERTTRRMRLTPYGRILIPYARNIVDLNNQFYNDVLLEESRENKNHVIIKSIPGISYYGIVQLLDRFQKECPDFTFDISSAYSESIMEYLRQDECELGFIREYHSFKSDDKVVSIPFAVDHIVAVVPENHRLAAYETIPLVELKGERVVTFPKDTLLYKIINNACMSVGVTPYVAVCDHNISQITDYVRLGVGVGLLMDRHMDPARTDTRGVKIINVTPRSGSKICLCYLKKASLSEGAKAFLEIFNEMHGLSGPDASAADQLR